MAIDSAWEYGHHMATHLERANCLDLTPNHPSMRLREREDRFHRRCDRRERVATLEHYFIGPSPQIARESHP
jgi:hypothetical protein